MAAVGRMLITGGSGFLGSVLSRKAGEAGYDVHATFYSNEPPAGQGVRAVHLDLRQSDKKTAQFVKTISPDVVIHTAYSQNDRSVTYGGTVSLARVCRAREVRPLFIFLSTDLVFDGVRGAYTEDDEPRPLMDYGRDKLDAEKAVLELLPDALVVRTSLIYDFSRVPSHLRFAVDACRAGQECAFFEDEYRCPVLADELADSILTLAGMERRAAGSVIHLAGADRIDRWWFGVRLLKVLGFPTGLVRRGSAKKMSIIRPSDCSLDCSRAKRIAGISLRGVKEVLGEQCPRGNQDG